MADWIVFYLVAMLFTAFGLGFWVGWLYHRSLRAAELVPRLVLIAVAALLWPLTVLAGVGLLGLLAYMGLAGQHVVRGR